MIMNADIRMLYSLARDILPHVTRYTVSVYHVVSGVNIPFAPDVFEIF